MNRPRVVYNRNKSTSAPLNNFNFFPGALLPPQGCGDSCRGQLFFLDNQGDILMEFVSELFGQIWVTFQFKKLIVLSRRTVLASSKQNLSWRASSRKTRYIFLIRMLSGILFVNILFSRTRTVASFTSLPHYQSLGPWSKPCAYFDCLGLTVC